MKILIIGSEGFVGSNLVLGLSKNYQVICADQLDSSKNKNYKKLDITNLENVNEVVRDVDVVVHLAAHSLVSSLDGTITNAQVNIIGLLNLLETCRKNNIKKIIFTSASSLIGEPNSQKVKENDSPFPKTAYGITKLTSEHYLRLYYELYKIEYVIFRFFNIYGPYQKNGLIPSLYSRIINGQPLTVFGKGNQIRDYVFINDVITFFDQAISSNTIKNEIFNLGTGYGTSIKEIIEHLSQILNSSPSIDFQPERPGEIGNFVADTDKLKNSFGKIPNTSVKEGLEKTIHWLKNS